MPVEADYLNVAEMIRELILKGFELSENDRHFLASSYAVSDAEALSDLIDAGEGDVVTELVIAPDPDIQAAVEPILSKAGFSARDLDPIAERVAAGNPDTEIRFPGADGSVAIGVDRYLAGRFVERLKIGNNPPESIYPALDSFSEPEEMAVLVSLRNSSVPHYEPVIDTVRLFIEKAALFGERFQAYFQYGLSVMEEGALTENCSPADIRACFTGKAESLKKVLETIDFAEKQMASGAMETLMMTGVRIPPASREETVEKLEMTERILWDLFYHVDLPERPPVERDLGAVSDKGELEKVFRLFS